MMLVLLFSLLGAGVVCAYIPWSERIVRVTSIIASGATSIVAGFLAYEAWGSAHRIGWAEMWNLDATAALALALIVPAYIAAIVFAERILAREHLEGSLSLAKFRHHFAGLHVVAAVLFLLALTTHFAFALGGVVSFIGLCVATYRCRAHAAVRPFAILRDGAFVAVLSIAGLRLQGLADLAVQDGIRTACIAVGLIILLLAAGYGWKKRHILGESAILFAIGMSIMTVGLGAAGIIATAMMWFALLVTSVLVHVTAMVDWSRPLSRYFALGLPPSALAIPYFIAFGYGLQLHPWVVLVAMLAYLMLIWRGVTGIRGIEAGKWTTNREHALIAVTLVVNVGLASVLSTPQVMLFIITGVGAISSTQ